MCRVVGRGTFSYEDSTAAFTHCQCASSNGTPREVLMTCHTLILNLLSPATTLNARKHLKGPGAKSHDTFLNF